jgi:hypothetical protein
MLSWATVTARADSGAITARLWEHGSGACVQVIDDVGDAGDLVYEFATLHRHPGPPNSTPGGGVCIEISDAFLMGRHGDWDIGSSARLTAPVAETVCQDDLALMLTTDVG